MPQVIDEVLPEMYEKVSRHSISYKINVTKVLFNFTFEIEKFIKKNSFIFTFITNLFKLKYYGNTKIYVCIVYEECNALFASIVLL